MIELLEKKKKKEWKNSNRNNFVSLGNFPYISISIFDYDLN